MRRWWPHGMPFAAVVRALPGVLAALLVAAFALRPALPSALVPVLLGVLALLFVASVVSLPSVRARAAAFARRDDAGYLGMLALIVGGGAALRFWGLGFGLPYFEHPDEWAVADRALTMLRTGNYDPGAFIYPTLFTYMQVGVAAAHFLAGASSGLYVTVADIDPSRYYVWARGCTALLGSGALVLVALLGRMLYSRAAGLLAAGLLALLPVVVADAHYVTTDTPSMFFALLALLPIAALSRAHPDEPPFDWRGLGRALLAGVCVGLAASTKYNVAVLLLALFVAIGYRAAAHVGASWLGALAAAGISVVGAALGFTLGTPLWLVRLPQLLNDVASIVAHYKYTGHAGAESNNPAMFYWGALAEQGWLVALLGLAGIVLAFVRHRRGDVLLLAFLVPSFLQLTGVKVVFIRNTVPLMPLICLLAAEAALLLWGWIAGPLTTTPRSRRFGAGRWLLPVLLALLVAQPLATSLRDGSLRAAPTTRLLATQWVEGNAPAGSRIWLEDQTLILPGTLRVQGGQPISTHPMDWYRDNGFRLLVVNHDARRTDRDRLAAYGTPVADFPNNGQRQGPHLSVYSTGVGDVSAEPRTHAGASLGGGALLLDGYNHPAIITAGSTLPLALYWQVVRPVSQDFVVYVHLLDAAGNKVAQRDTPPLDGSRPTSQWKAGELIRDDQDLPLPPTIAPGTYRIVVGMYDAATLAAINEHGPIDVGSITIAN